MNQDPALQDDPLPTSDDTASASSRMAKRQRAEECLSAIERHYRDLNAVLEQRVAERTAELQAANALLREREEGLQFVLEGSRLGTWDWNIVTGEVSRNDYWAEMLGFTPEEVDDALVDGWLELIHPEDRERAWQSINAHLAGTAPVHEIEYRMRTRDGGHRWILDRARIVSRDEAGRPLRMSGTHEDITDRKQAQLALEESHQRLTTVLNAMDAQIYLADMATHEILFMNLTLTRVFGQVEGQETARAARYGEPLSLLLFDIDHFKAINDAYGHQVGDQVLIELTRRVGEHLRVNDVLARWGGEEFVVMLPHCEATEALRVAEKLRVLVQAQPFAQIGQVTSSFGVADFRPADNLDTWLKRADEALYAAKAGGRNRVCLDAGPTEQAGIA